MRLIITAAAILLASSLHGAIFTVSNADDSGPGSLRQAIHDANSTPETDYFRFISDGMTIHPLSELPHITQPLHIDGPATIDGTDAGPSASGLVVDGVDEGSIFFVLMRGFSGAGVRVQNCHGVTPPSLRLYPTVTENGTGIIVTNSSGFSVHAKAISNRTDGVVITGASKFVVDDSSSSKNGGNGVVVRDAGDGLIGGDTYSICRITCTTSHINFIRENAGDGIVLERATVRVSGNFVERNGGDGLHATDSRSEIAPILGLPPNFSANGGAGIRADGLLRIGLIDTSQNGGLGIDFGAPGPSLSSSDGYLAAPRLFHAVRGESETVVHGTFAGKPASSYDIELLLSGMCDPSGFGEGSGRLGSTNVTTDAQGNASFSIATANAPVGTAITARASNEALSSEYGDCLIVTAAVAEVPLGSATVLALLAVALCASALSLIRA